MRKESKAQEEVHAGLMSKVEAIETELRAMASRKLKHEERKAKISRHVASEEAVFERLKDGAGGRYLYKLIVRSRITRVKFSF